LPIDDIAAARARVEEISATEPGELRETKFEDGFTVKSVIGAFFVGIIMLPGGLYLGLVAGAGLGPAAEWVTIVLFAEVMRRSFLPMKRQEIYILYYVAAMLSSVILEDRAIFGGPFGHLMWLQYFRQAPQAGLVAQEIPAWAVPPAGSAALVNRTFFNSAWLFPILILVINEILGRFNWLSMGYVLFRVTSDVEKLPFPMAPVAASGATALAEAASKEESWRWSVFSIGTVAGMVFGLFYLAIPIFTGVVFGKSLELIPIPFIDLTQSTETILPASVTGVSGDMGKLVTGFVLPFPIVAGQMFGSFVSRIFPMPLILYHAGVFGTGGENGWQPGMDAWYTKQATDLKFWMSFTVGLQLAVAVIGIAYVIAAINRFRRDAAGRGLFAVVPKGRGDVAMWKPLLIWFSITVFYIFFAQHLLALDGHAGLFPWWLLVFYGLVWTPINSFVSARMVGLTGAGVTFPWLKEVSIMKSGYPYVDIWYAPIPLADYGGHAQKFREVELTCTKFSSVVKVELLVLPIFLVSSFVFWAFFWHTSEIPSSQHPFAQRVWPITATFQAMFQSINKQSDSAMWVKEAVNVPRIAGGAATGLALFGACSILKLPSLFYYGMIAGMNSGPKQWPPDIIPTFVGACLGRYYFQKRFGLERWTMYTPVLLAGFACGTGLVAMAAIALSLIAKSVNYLPF